MYPFNNLRLNGILGSPTSVMMDDPTTGGISGNLPHDMGPIGNIMAAIGRGASPTTPNAGTMAPDINSSMVTNPAPSNPNASDESNNDESSINYNPRSAAYDAYMQHLQSMPHREEPSTLRKIGAVLGSFAGAGPAAYVNGTAVGFKNDPRVGAAVSDNILFGKYNRDLTDWETANKPLESAVRDENSYNTNQRMLALGERQREIQQQRADAYQQAQEARAENDKNKLEVSRQRAAAYDFKIHHPNHQIKEDNQGNLIAVDPQSGESKFVLNYDGTPIKGSQLPEADKLTLMNQNALSQINARTAGQVKLENTRESNRQSDISARGDETRKNIDKRQGADSTAVTDTNVTRDAQGNVVGTHKTVKKIPNEPKVQMYGPDGNPYMIPQSKVQEAKEKYKMTEQPMSVK